MIQEMMTVLIVDDEEQIRKMMIKLLTSNKCKILTAASGNEALSIVEKNQIDFVITDIRMANGDGISLLSEIRKRNAELPIVLMMTGFSEITREEAIQMGAIDLLPKPLDLKKICQYIEEAYSKLRSKFTSTAQHL